MAKAMYAVVDGTTKKIKNAYCVVGGVTKKLKAVYTVVDGTTKLVWKSGGVDITYPFEGILSFVGSNNTEADRDVTKLALTTGLTGTLVVDRSQSTSGYNMRIIAKNGKSMIVKNWLYVWNESTQSYYIAWNNAFRPYTDIKNWLDYTNGDGVFGQPAITRDGKYVALVYFSTSEYENYVGKGLRVYSCTFDGSTNRAALVGALDFTTTGRIDAEEGMPSSQSYAKVSCSDDLSTIAASCTCGTVSFWIVYTTTNQDVTNATKVTSSYRSTSSSSLCEVSADGKYLFIAYNSESGAYTDIYTIADGKATRIYSKASSDDAYGSCGTKKLMDYGDGYFDIIEGNSSTGTVYSYFINGSTVTYLGKYSLSRYYVLADISFDKQYGVQTYNKSTSKTIGYCSVSRNNTNLITGTSNIYSASYKYVNYNPYNSVLLA